jgi:hypothetical protein
MECGPGPSFVFLVHSEERVLLTEAEVQRSYRQILKKSSNDPEALDRAEALLDELRPESPLRHRLLSELSELRKLAGA